MAWCPKCKNEYREGITVCADCGSVLVDWNSIADEYDYKRDVSDQDDYDIRDDGEDGLAEKFTDDVGSVAENSNAVSEQPAEDEATETTASEDEEESVFVTAYKSNSEKAEDNRSSAWTFLVVGTLGIVFVVLGIIGVLPFSIGNPYLFYGVMSAVFVLFIVMGLVSVKNARIFEKRAESENSLRETIASWCKESLSADEIDAKIMEAEGWTRKPSEELLYFKRCESMKKKLNHQFLNLDEDFVDHFIDMEVYEMVFGEHDSSL